MATPAAVLSILVKADGVARASGQIRSVQGDLSKTDRTAGQMADTIDQSANRSRKAFALMKVAAGGMVVGVAAAGVALKKSAEAAIEEEKSNARLQTQLRALGVSYSKHADVIGRVIQKHAQLSGLDDEDLQDSFTNIVRVTGDVDRSLRLTGLAADFARAKHMDVAKAGELVAKVAGGNTGILSRYGIQIEEGASATEALGVLQQKFAGQAEAYGKTTAGAQDRFRVAVENLQEKIGAFLLPVLGRFFNGLTNLITAAQGGTGALGSLGGVFDRVRDAVVSFADALGMSKADWAAFGQAVSNVFQAIQSVAQRALPGVLTMLRGFGQTLGGIVKIITGVLTLDFARAWDGVKQTFSGAIKVILGGLRAATAPIREAASAAFGGIRKAAGAVYDWLREAAGDVIQAVLKLPETFLRGLAQMADAASKIPVIGDKFDGLRDGLNRTADSIQDLGVVAGADMEKVSKALRRTAETGAQNLGRLREQVRRTATVINEQLGAGTRPGTEALAKNFKTAMNAVARQMQRGRVSTREGLQAMVGMMTDTLKAFGINQGSKVLREAGVGTLTDEPVLKQRGGFINLGDPSGDSVRAMLERGEYVLNRKAVRAVGKRNLDALNYGMAPRFQSGGIVELLHPFNDPGGHGGSNSHLHVAMSTVQAIVALGRRLQRLGWHVSEHPAFGGVNFRHDPDGYHYTSQAIDVNWPDPGMEAAKIRALLPMLESGSGLGKIVGAAIKRARMRGGLGAITAIGQIGLDKTRKVLQKRLDDLIGSVTVEGAESGLGGGASANQRLGRTLMSQFFSATQWPALQELWTRESGWNNMERNPSSGAFGIPQALPASKMGAAAVSGDARAQILWGLRYIRDRYGSPSSALAFHNANNWYQRGGVVPGHGTGDRVPAMLEPGEYVIPKKAMQGFKAGGAVGGYWWQKQWLQTWLNSAMGIPRLDKAAGTATISDDLIAIQDILAVTEGFTDTAMRAGDFGYADWLRGWRDQLTGFQSNLEQYGTRFEPPDLQAIGDNLGGLPSGPFGGLTGDGAADPAGPSVEDLIAAIEALKASVDEQNAVNSSVIGISLREAQRALADVISGEIVGHGVVPRSALPSNGTVASY